MTDFIPCPNCLAQIPKENFEEHKAIFHAIKKAEPTTLANPLYLKAIEKKTVCIVKFTGVGLVTGVPGRFFQVTIDPQKISPSGEFIRFGSHPGDELVGWQRVDWLAIEEILGVWTDEKPPELSYGTGGVTMLVAGDE